MRKFFILAAGLAVGLSTTANASGSGNPPPFKIHEGGITFVSHLGATPIPAVAGYNLIDKPETVTCNSANGCLITITTSMYLNGTNGTKICAFVDGYPAEPPCSPQMDGYVANTRQRALVTQGTHTVQTEFYSYNSGGDVENWEADYMLFDHAAKH